MTWAEQLKQEGIEQGIEKGIEQAQGEQLQRARARVLRMLRLKFQDVSAEVEQQVEAAGLDALETWTERILIAGSVAEVIAS